jgi:hypothetical protein
MKKSKLVDIIKEILDEMSTTGGGAGAAPTGGAATFTPGTGEQYAVPLRTTKKKVKKGVTKETADSGYKEIQRPKHPSHTDMWDFKDFRGAKLKN